MATDSLARHTALLRVLAHPVRLRAIILLGMQPLRVCQLGAALGLPFSTISTHLAALRHAGVVEETRVGRAVTYRLTRDPATRAAMRGFRKAVEGDAAVRADKKALAKTLTLAPEELCGANLDLAALARPCRTRT